MQPKKTRNGRRLWSAGHTLITGVVVVILATLLNANALLETAQRQPHGSATRAVAVGLMTPVARVSDFLLLDTPRHLVDSLLGKASNTEPPPDATPADIETTVTTQVSSSSTTTAPPFSSTTIASSLTTTAAPAGPTSTTTTTTTLAAPTETDPMFLWLIGDSFLELFGHALQNDAFETGVVEAENGFRFITSLTRPDYFDWPAHARERMPELEPDAVLVMFGGNDGEPMIVDGVRLAPDSPEWIEVYQTLIGEMMDLLIDEGASRVYWVGLPIMRSRSFTERVVLYNDLYRTEAEKRPEVTYISSFELFQNEDGEYSTYLVDENGNLQAVRTSDGAHLAWPGAYRLARHVLPIIAEDWGFTDRLG